MACWFARLSPALAFLLSVSLCISPVLSCYAYADQLNQGQEVECGGEDDRGTGSANESGEGGAQPQADGEVGAGAEEGEAQKENFSKASSSGLSALGGGSPLGLDGASEDAYLYWPGGGDDSGPDRLGEDDGSGNDSGGAGELPEYGLSAYDAYDTVGAADGGGLQDLSDDEEVNHDDLIDAHVIPAVPASILNALAWIGTATTTAGYVDQFVNWFSGGDKNEKANIAVNAANFGMLKVIAQILHDELIDIQANTYQTRLALSSSGVVGSRLTKLVDYNVNEYYDGYTYSTAKYLAFIFRELEQAETLSKGQWGYGYGGTVVINSNSPAGWLQKIRDYNVNEYYDGYTYSTAKYLSFIFREMERANAKLNYNGSLVGGAAGDYSAARLLARIHNALYGTITYAETGGTAVRSPVEILGYIANLTHYGNNDLMMIAGRNLYNGSLVGADSGDTYYSTARLLARIHNALYGDLIYTETGNGGVRSAVSVLGYIANLVYDTQYSHGVLIETGTSGKRSLADLLRYTANLVYLSKGEVSSLGDLMRADSSMLSKGFTDVLAALGVLHDDMGAGIAVDTSGVESRLDKIAGLLLAAGAVENTKDLLGALVGDLDFTRLAALSAEVEGAISSAFPFCIPAVLKQVLGLVAADPAPPCWEFDIAGEPLLCDFAPFQPVADVTGWVARICFLFALLVNTRRFVYMGGGAE